MKTLFWNSKYIQFVHAVKWPDHAEIKLLQYPQFNFILSSLIEDLLKQFGLLNWICDVTFPEKIE